MQSIKGTVKALSKYGKGFALEGVDGWFTAYKDSDVAGAVVGATVEFKYSVKANPKGADYQNIQGAVNVVSAAPANSGGGGKGGGRGNNTGDQIIRQNALTNATALYTSGVVVVPSSQKELMTAILQTANVFAAFSKGDLVITGMPGTEPTHTAAPEPTPEPEPEPAPEPAPAPAPASSLDDFMGG